MTTKTLLRCGMFAGPVFVGGSLAQAATRDGYDLRRHPVSLLSLGEHGWLQVAVFVVSGALLIACAAGLRRVLHPGRAGTWGPVLVGALGAGLVLAGVFVTDAGAGFPPGAPEGAPELSWHGWLHGLGTTVSFNGMAVGCLVFARRFAGDRERGWTAVAVTAAVLPTALVAWPTPDGFSVRLLVAAALMFAFAGALGWRYTRTTAETARQAEISN